MPTKLLVSVNANREKQEYLLPANIVVSLRTFGDQHFAGRMGCQKCDGGSHCAKGKITASAEDMNKMTSRK